MRRKHSIFTLLSVLPVSLFSYFDGFKTNSTVFGYYLYASVRFCIVDFDEDGEVVSVEEKHAQLKSNYAITGYLYFFSIL